MELSGRIVEERKNYFVIDTGRGLFQSTRSGLLKKNNRRLCAGDVVAITVNNTDTNQAVITAIEPRHTFIPRPPLANLDQVILVSTIREPLIEFEVVDRFIVTAGAYGFTPLILFNKADLLSAGDRPAAEQAMAVYRAIGHECIETSVVSGLNIATVIERCRNKLSCFAGVSGVGKSALLQQIFPDREFRIGDLARATGRGSHTTTHSTLIALPGGGHIADTPGFSFLDLPDIDEETLVGCFSEIAAAQGVCRFANCTHIDEPGCTIKEMVDQGRIARSRYYSYVKFFQLTREQRRQYRGTQKRSGQKQMKERSVRHAGHGHFNPQ
jgi:ribosome biogenesis GTPase